MPRTLLALIALTLSLDLPAQEGTRGPRADHYIDHIVLGVNDLERGTDEVQRLTGVRPKFDGRDPRLGTHSAVIGLGDRAFLEIIAPDPEADPSAIDAGLEPMFADRLENLETLTPFTWAIGSSNLETTKWLARRVGSHVSDVMSGSRKRSWGRTVEWRWVRVDRPQAQTMPIFVRWNADTRAPRQRAPKGCTLKDLQIETRIFKPVQALLAATQIEAETTGSDDESLRFTLDCEGREVVFEPVSLVEKRPIRQAPQQ